MARFINCVAFAFYYYAVTYIIIINVLWTEGVSEINGSCHALQCRAAINELISDVGCVCVCVCVCVCARARVCVIY